LDPSASVTATFDGRRRAKARYQRLPSTAYSARCASFRMMAWMVSSNGRGAPGQMKRRAGRTKPPVGGELAESVENARIPTIQRIGATQSEPRMLATLYRWRGRVAPDARRDPR